MDERTCAVCGAPVIGRKDKKYCQPLCACNSIKRDQAANDQLRLIG